MQHILYSPTQSTSSVTMHLCGMEQSCRHTHAQVLYQTSFTVYTFTLLLLSYLSDPIAFCHIVGKEEDAEKEEDLKTSKHNEKEAIAVVSTPTCLYLLYRYILMAN